MVIIWLMMVNNLVGGWASYEKWWSSSVGIWDDEIPNKWKNV